MRGLWETVTPREFGIPEPEVNTSELVTLANKVTKVMTWIPGMNVRHDGTFYFVLWHGGDVKRFFNAGGDVDHLILHFLTFDCGVINPWWNPTSFKDRVERARDEWKGIKYLVSPDFSSWANMPVVSQLMNHYRSAVVTRDLLKSGFTVIPNISWSCRQLTKVMIDTWPVSLTLVLLDANHIGKSALNDHLFFKGFDYLLTKKHKKYIIYSGNKDIVKRLAVKFSKAHGIEYLWTPSRIRILGEYVKAIAKLTKEKKGDKAYVETSIETV